MSNPDNLSLGIESKELLSKTDIVVIRPPASVPDNEFTAFVTTLSRHGFLPLLLPQPIPGREADYFPTDNFREIAGTIFENGIAFPGILKFLDDILPSKLIDDIKSRLGSAPPFLPGSEFVYSDKHKLFIYSNIDVPEESENGVENIDKFISIFKHSGWTTIPVVKKDIRLQGELYEEDLDFLMSSPFEGKDAKLHVIVADSFLGRVPDIVTPHRIPDLEALTGGCNIADLRRGEVLIPKKDAPTTNAILQQYAISTIIQAPVGFYDGGGGPRCSISSFSIRSRWQLLNYSI